MERPLVCCVGDLVVDIVVRLGAPMRADGDTPARIERHRGGAAANVAAALVADGCAARFVGRVGDDDQSLALVAALERVGVETLVQFEGRTGTIVVVVSSDGERSFLTDRGAAPDLENVDVDIALADVSWVHVPWYSLHSGPIATTTSVLLHEARRRDIPASLDASSVSLLALPDASRFRDAVVAFSPSVVLCNLAEAELLGIEGTGTGLQGADLTIVKRGGRDALVLGRRHAATAVATEHRVESALDTTGAGDSFAAGLVHGLLSGVDPIDAVAAAHRVASSVVGHLGAADDDRGLPDQGEW